MSNGTLGVSVIEKKLLTQSAVPVLNTERRSQQRALYEEKKEREPMKAEEMAMERVKEEEEGWKRMAEYRHSLLFKAQPIKYKPVVVSYGDKKLTTPLTPTLMTSKRHRV